MSLSLCQPEISTQNSSCGPASQRNSFGTDDLIAIAHETRTREGAAATCAKSVAAFGKVEEQVTSTPEVLMNLSCSNSVAAANLKEGEIIVVLGCEDGTDIFLAAEKVGPTGSAIGLDLSEDMIVAARKHAAEKSLKPPQVAFVKAHLTEKLPIESNSVDCIISNCVTKLHASLPKEINRILKPGGRIILNDIVAKKPLPENIKNEIVSPISGAITLEEYQSIFRDAEFINVIFVETKRDLNVYYENRQDGIASTVGRVVLSKLPYDLNEWVGTYQINALKRGQPVETSSTVLTRWWDAYPIAKSSPSNVTADEIVALKKDPASGAQFAVIDLRRYDHGGGHVRGSDNWVAQTFYDNLPAFYEKYKDTPKVIFYCSSSKGRAPRCAGWYQDYLDSQEGYKSSTPYVLKGGVKNWLAHYGDDDDLVDRD